MFKFTIILSVIISSALAMPSIRRPINSKDLSDSSEYDFNINYDQRQTGEANIRVNLKDAVFGVPGDLLDDSSYEDVDYSDSSTNNNNSTTTNSANLTDSQADQIVLLALADFLSKNNDNSTGTTSGSSPLNQQISDLKDKLQNDFNKNQQSRIVSWHQIRKFIKRWFRI